MDDTKKVKKKEKEVSFGNEAQSLCRPGWTSDDLHAYKHKHTQCQIIENYYVRRGGLI